MACRLYSNLGMTAASYSVGGTTMYPYFIYASYADGQLELLPVMVSGDLAYISAIRPYRLSNPGTTAVKALDDYVAAYSAPEKVDVSEIVDALTYVSNLRNYTISSEITFTDSDGNLLPENSAYRTSYDYFYMLNRAPGTRSATEDAYHSTNFSGTYVNPIPGGYWSYDGVTYRYNQNLVTGEYFVTGEALDYGATEPFAHWYSYTIMQNYIPTGAISMNNVRNSYPEYDEETKTYTMTADLAAARNVMLGVVTLGYHADVTTQTSGVYYLSMVNGGTLKWNFAYDEEDVISEITMTLEYRLTDEVFDSLSPSQVFLYKDVIKINNIGTTDVSEYTNQLKVPSEEDNA